MIQIHHALSYRYMMLSLIYIKLSLIYIKLSLMYMMLSRMYDTGYMLLSLMGTYLYAS